MATRKIQEIQAVNFIPKNKKPVRGNGDLNSWQKDCQAKIDSWKRAIISSPTGSGKSALAMVRGAVLLARNSKLKHLVSVPQNIIATSFTKESLEEKLPKAAWPGIGKLTWCVSSKDSSSKVSELYNFLVGNTSKTPSKRLMVCTHQALVAVFRKLQDDGKLDVLKNVVLTIDEVHHSMSFEAEDATIENRLGEVVKHFFENDLRMDMFTATFMRGNFMDIIPAKYKEGKDFVKYVRHIDEHLEEKGISVSIRFLICSAEDALKRIYQENSSMKTIVYLPPVNSWVMSGYGSKYDMLSELQGVLKKKVKSIDLVSEEGREVRKNDFLNNIGKDEPDLLFALNMCKEGFDWPVASRAVVIGIRGSMVDTIQMLGRLLRGVDGKAKQVEFNIVMPVSEDPEPELIRDYLNVVLHQLIIDWQFRRPKLVNVKDQKVADKVFSESPTIGQKVLSAGLDAIIGASDEADADKTIRRGIDKVDGITKEEKDRLAPMVRRMFSRGLGPEDLPNKPEMVCQTFGNVKAWLYKFGYKSLREYRESCGKKIVPTVELILEAARNWENKYGVVPYAATQGEIPELPGHNWMSISAGVRNSCWGLPKKYTLAKLLAENGFKNRAAKIKITLNLILLAAKNWVNLYGNTPNRDAQGEIPELPRYTWANINDYLRGINSSLIKFLAKNGFETSLSKTKPTFKLILLAAKNWEKNYDVIPSANTKGDIPELPGYNWNGINKGLEIGSWGILQGYSLAKLLAANGFKNSLSKTKPTFKLILLAAKNWEKNYNIVPHQNTQGEIPELPGYTWSSIDAYFRRGTLGHLKDYSLPKFLASNGFENRLTKIKPTIKLILLAIKNWKCIHDILPCQGTSGEIPELPGHNWTSIEASFKRGVLDFPKGYSLAKFKTDNGFK